LKIVFSDQSWPEYRDWAEREQKGLLALNRLIEDIRRSPFTGLGKPEPLKGEFAGWWLRRITQEHRLVYRVVGAGAEQRVEIAQCRYNY